MKKFFGVLITIAIIFIVTAVSAFAESNYIRGDADGDGTVTILDATVIQRKLVNVPVASFNDKAADVDGDGLDITDATKIQRKLAELPDPYHIGEIVSENTKPTQDEYELPFISN